MYGKTGVNILSLSLSILTPDRNTLLPGLPCIYLSIYFNAGPARPSAWLAREKERSSLLHILFQPITGQDLLTTCLPTRPGLPRENIPSPPTPLPGLPSSIHLPNRPLILLMFTSDLQVYSQI